MKKIFAIIVSLILLSSCEDVIEIELDSLEPRLVIEACLNDSPGPFQVRLSKTGDYFEEGIYPVVSEAEVFLSDSYGRVYPLPEIEPGVYGSDEVIAESGISYILEVNSGGQSYHAEASMPGQVKIDFLSSIIPPMIFDFDEGYMINCHFQDPLQDVNYYRMKAWKISDSEQGRNTKMVFNDQFQEGKFIMAQWDAEAFFPMDTVVVELQNLDQATYMYYFTLFPLSGDMLFGASNPSNPKSNLSGNALGYFGSYTLSRDTLVILPGTHQANGFPDQ